MRLCFTSVHPVPGHESPALEKGYSFILSLNSAPQKDGCSTPRLGKSFRIDAKNTCYFRHARPAVFPRVSARLPVDALREF